MKKKKSKKSAPAMKWKYTFLVRVYGYGGELMVGTVSEDFTKFWEQKDPDELLSHIRSFGGSDEMKDSPDLSTKIRFAHPDEVADVLHTELVTVDASMHIQQVELQSGKGALPILVDDPIIFELPDGIKGEIEFDYTATTKRKAAARSKRARPVLSSIYWESGDFFTGYIQTNKYFDKACLGLVLIRTNHGLFVNTWTYEGKVIPMSYVTDGVKVKGADAVVGWCSTRQGKSHP